LIIGHAVESCGRRFAGLSMREAPLRILRRELGPS